MNTLSFIIHTAVIIHMKKIVTNLKKQQKGGNRGSQSIYFF